MLGMTPATRARMRARKFFRAESSAARSDDASSDPSSRCHAIAVMGHAPHDRADPRTADPRSWDPGSGPWVRILDPGIAIPGEGISDPRTRTPGPVPEPLRTRSRTSTSEVGSMPRIRQDPDPGTGSPGSPGWRSRTLPGPWIGAPGWRSWTLLLMYTCELD